MAETPEARAVAALMHSYDRGGKRDSEWWGHPDFSTMSDGSLLVKVPINMRNIQLMHECGAVPADDFETRRRLSFFRQRPAEFTTELPLMPFQKEGAKWLLGRDLCGILAFGVGLGKTLTSLATMMSDPERFFPCVLLAPAHLKLNWEREWNKWGGKEEDVVVLFGRKTDPSTITGRKLIVLNQHIVAEWVDTLIAAKPKTLVIDEAHNFVNSNTKTYPIVDRIAESCGRRVLLLTATPLVNNLGDLWGLYNLIRHDILGNKTDFSDTFMPEERAKAKLLASRWRGGFVSKGWADVARQRLPKALRERRIGELKYLLHSCVVLRKRKVEVVDQLPVITETHLQLDIPRTTKEGITFWETEERCAFNIQEGKEDILASPKMLAAYGLAKRNAAEAKVPYAIDWLKDFLVESDPEEKIVVAGWSVDPLEKLHAAFPKESLLVNGSVDSKKKYELGDRFASDPRKRILFGNYRSIGSGIDQLVVARTMLIFELPLTDVELEQLKGRTDRLSQKSKHLEYYFMTIRNAIEETKGWQIIKSKKKLAVSLDL